MYKRGNIIVIGCGPHFRSKYFKMLFDKIVNEQSIQISLIIDLESQKEKIIQFYRENDISFNSLYIKDELKHYISIQEIDHLVQNLIDINSVKGILICTEPQFHKIYIEWAASRGLDIFVDKPITAFNGFANRKCLYNEYQEIRNTVQKNDVKCVVSCERRMHVGYKLLFDFLNNFIKNHELPISDVDIHFSGGVFLQPGEEAKRDCHPFKYGYGVLLHSGYHYVDLLANLLKINSSIFDFSIKNIDIKSKRLKFDESFNKYVKKFSSRYFKCYNEDKNFNFKYGESNYSMIGNLSDNQNIITNFSLRLLSCGTTLRKYYEVDNNDLGMLAGRMRQEFVIIHLNPACSIQIISNPYDKLGASNESKFTIKILQNNYLTGGEQYTSIDENRLKEIYRLGEKISLNTEARKDQLYDFLLGNDGNSSFESHDFTVQLLDKIYKNIQ